MTKMLLKYEQSLMEGGAKLIGGIDEAGRGPLAGPVVVAGVIMPLEPERIIDGVNDSKKLSAKKRDKLYDEIIARAIDVQVAVIDNRTIDEINILNATKQGMIKCINGFKRSIACLSTRCNSMYPCAHCRWCMATR